MVINDNRLFQVKGLIFILLTKNKEHFERVFRESGNVSAGEDPAGSVRRSDFS